MMRRWGHWIQYLALRGLRFVLFRLNLRVAALVGAGLGLLAFRLGVRKRVAMENLLWCDLGLSSDGARDILRQAYTNLGRTAVELLCLDRPDAGSHCTIAIDPAYAKSSAKGSIIASVHLGNWELLAKLLIQNGVRLAVVVRRQANPRVDAFINEIRHRAGYTIVYEDQIRSMAEFVANGYALGLVADQDFGANRVQTFFLGRQCRTARGPEYFVRRYGLPLFLAYGIREGGHSHRFHLEAIDCVEAMDRDGAITRLLTARIEQIVRCHPEQWLWQHRRWKNPP